MKGKAAVQNANRRTAEAVERAEQLASELSAEKQARKAEVRALADELRAARGALESEVEDRAAARAAAVEQRAHDATEQQAYDSRARAVKALNLLINDNNRTAIPMSLALDVAAALGFPDAIQSHNAAGDNRSDRRAGRYRQRAIVELNSAYIGGIKQEPTFGAPGRTGVLHGTDEGDVDGQG